MVSLYSQDLNGEPQILSMFFGVSQSMSFSILLHFSCTGEYGPHRLNLWAQLCSLGNHRRSSLIHSRIAGLRGSGCGGRADTHIRYPRLLLCLTSNVYKLRSDLPVFLIELPVLTTTTTMAPVVQIASSSSSPSSAILPSFPTVYGVAAFIGVIAVLFALRIGCLLASGKTSFVNVAEFGGISQMR